MSDRTDNEAERESRSARKRAAESAQELGERLIALPDAELAALALPEKLLDAVREARRISSRAAGARQRQYIGKLMRSIDIEPIRVALAAKGELDALERQRFARAEKWRDRLIAEGEAALDELKALRPGIDLDAWRELIANARGAAARAGQRELFRALRSLLG